MNGATPSKLKPALIAGVACGVASSIPFVNCINLCCCALVIGGGFLAVFLYFKESPPPAEAPYGDGAVLGLLTGVFGALTATVIGIPINLLMTQIGLQPDMAQLEEALEGADMPPAALEFLENFLAGGGVSVVAILTSLVFSLIIYSIFALVGGIIGVAVLHKKQVGGAAPPPPPAPTV